MKKALIHKATGMVVNVIEANDNYQPQEGYITISCGAVNPGDTWDGTQFIPNPLPWPTTGWPAAWDAAKTDKDQIAVLARMLGLNAKTE